MVMTGARSEQCSAQRHLSAEELFYHLIALPVQNELNAPDPALRSVDIIAAGDGTQWRRQIQVEADLLLITLRSLAIPRRAVVHVPGERPADPYSIRRVA